MTPIYQTLEDRGNREEVAIHGPYLCRSVDEKGEKKSGTREPWMGEGYYFWDTRIEDAKWWGDEIYGDSRYIIGRTSFDEQSELLFDTVGRMADLDDFLKCIRLLRDTFHPDRLTIPFVIAFLRRAADFPYKAIRMCPSPRRSSSDPDETIEYPGGKATLLILRRVQICFFDKTLLTEPFVIVYPEETDLSGSIRGENI